MIATAPQPVGEYRPTFVEYARWQYLPVVMPWLDDVRLPPPLEVFRQMVQDAMDVGGRNWEDHVYLTVKRGWATTESPLNRPGWHVDAYGTPEDRNLVWLDRFPTRYILGDIGVVPKDDAGALKMFEWAGRMAKRTLEVDAFVMYEFGQTVVHATPIIETPGERTFVKISISPHRYNLQGNAHNWLFDYEWEMYPRAVVRNDPIFGNKDYYIK